MMRLGINTAHGRGRPIPAPPLPLWTTSQAPGTWSVVPFSNTLASLNPSGNPAINPNHPSAPEWNGSTGHAGIVSAYCGACYDESSDRIWLPLQGGHADYAGNEPYVADLWSDTPSWSMVRYPSGAVGNVLTTNDGQEATGLYSDGRRRAIHSYNKPVYVPGLGPCIATQGNTSWTAGGGTNDFLILNEATGEMTAGAANPEPATSSGSGSCYDPSRHAVWYKGAATGSFVKYDVDGDSWATVGSASSSSNYSSLCYLPDDDCILWGNDFLTQKYAVFDCATGTLYTPTFSGTPAGSLRPGHSQPRWVPELGAACAWDNSTDTTAITRFTPGANPRTDPWSIDTLSVDGANAVTPSARAAAGTYGRFIYATNLGGFVLFNSTSGPIYFFKVL